MSILSMDESEICRITMYMYLVLDISLEGYKFWFIWSFRNLNMWYIKHVFPKYMHMSICKGIFHGLCLICSSTYMCNIEIYYMYKPTFIHFYLQDLPEHISSQYFSQPSWLIYTVYHILLEGIKFWIST